MVNALTIIVNITVVVIIFVIVVIPVQAGIHSIFSNFKPRSYICRKTVSKYGVNPILAQNSVANLLDVATRASIR